MELKIPSDSRWLRVVRAMMEEVSRLAGFSGGERCDVIIAVDEALSNVIKHSCKGDPDSQVSVSCVLDNGCLEIILSDRGEAFDPTKIEPPPPDEVRPGGRGIYLMRSTMDEISFERNGDINRVRLRKYVKAPVR